ncbi:MAG: hypothetical protein ACRCZQ_02040 [Bacteroidales bacterium]
MAEKQTVEMNCEQNTVLAELIERRDEIEKIKKDENWEKEVTKLIPEFPQLSKGSVIILLGHTSVPESYLPEDLKVVIPMLDGKILEKLDRLDKMTPDQKNVDVRDGLLKIVHAIGTLIKMIGSEAYTSDSIAETCLCLARMISIRIIKHVRASSQDGIAEKVYEKTIVPIVDRICKFVEENKDFKNDGTGIYAKQEVLSTDIINFTEYIMFDKNVDVDDRIISVIQALTDISTDCHFENEQSNAVRLLGLINKMIKSRKEQSITEEDVKDELSTCELEILRIYKDFTKAASVNMEAKRDEAIGFARRVFER